VNKYLVTGNSILTPQNLGDIFANVPDAFGTNVSFDGVRAVLGDLQTAYRERGFVTVAVGLPQQKLTNAEVKVKVTEGRLSAINVEGNRHYSSNNIVRALPSLHTNMLLNAKVFQRELDNANASRDRQIYPVIGSGTLPGDSELTLKVKDRLPFHSRLEINNQATPDTPDLRLNYSAQYDNLWDRDHQIGFQYGYTPGGFYKVADNFSKTPLDDPLIANYSGYYRMPLGGYSSVQQQIDNYPSSFGYNEVTRQFVLPPPTGRPELTVYASRSVSDTGVIYPTPGIIIATNTFTLSTNNSGEIVTLNEGLGARLSIPLPVLSRVSGAMSFGLDYKNYKTANYQTNNSFFQIQVGTDPVTGDPIFATTTVSQAQPALFNHVQYMPLNAGLNVAVPDKLGTMFYNAQLNFGIPIFSQEIAVKTTQLTNGSTVTTRTVIPSNPETGYVTLQMGADREQAISKDWSLRLHADGQWADHPIISNEQFAMGGVAGVRGYTDGEAYGNSGWRLSIEPQTRLFNIGVVGNEGSTEICWARSSVFFDCGEIYLSPATGKDSQSFAGVGWSFTLNLGTHMDGRLTVGYPLINDTLTSTGTRAGEVHVYFGLGGQF
jgi:hemolysin activation/secretion protein